VAKFVHRDYTEEATGLFSRFVERHKLSYQVDHDAPVEVLWRLPVQEGLSLPLTLGLQNWDELNLGVEQFWSYFFPFDDVAEEFEQFLDMWIAGDARVGVTGKRSRILQVRDGTDWKTVYKAGGLQFFTPKPRSFIYNDPAHSNSTMT
jgi:hypothetical protein